MSKEEVEVIRRLIQIAESASASHLNQVAIEAAKALVRKYEAQS